MLGRKSVRKGGELVEPKLYRFEEDEGIRMDRDGNRNEYGHDDRGADEKGAGAGIVDMVEKVSLARREIAEHEKGGGRKGEKRQAKANGADDGSGGK